MLVIKNNYVKYENSKSKTRNLVKPICETYKYSYKYNYKELFPSNSVNS